MASNVHVGLSVENRVSGVNLVDNLEDTATLCILRLLSWSP